MVKPIGHFVCKSIGEEYVEMDSYEHGNINTYDRLEEDGCIKIDNDGTGKDFNEFQEGSFYKFGDRYQVVRSNELFTKVKVGNHLVSFPNHKLEGSDPCV